MERIRLRVTSAGVTWVMAECGVCHSVSEHPILEAADRSMRCPKCGHHMDIRQATIDAVDKTFDDGEPKT